MDGFDVVGGLSDSQHIEPLWMGLQADQAGQAIGVSCGLLRSRKSALQPVVAGGNGRWGLASLVVGVYVGLSRSCAVSPLRLNSTVNVH